VRSFSKYLFLGLLGLVFGLALPRLTVDWLALVWVSAYLSSPKKSSAWLLLAILAATYSAFSLSPAWQLVLPMTASALLDSVLRRNLSLGTPYRRFLLLAFCEIGRLLVWAAVGGLAGAGWILNFSDATGALMTLATGLVLLPFAAKLLSSSLQRLVGFGRSARRMDLSRADWFSDRAARLARKPFGFEKGL